VHYGRFIRKAQDTLYVLEATMESDLRDLIENKFFVEKMKILKKNLFCGSEANERKMINEFFVYRFACVCCSKITRARHAGGCFFHKLLTIINYVSLYDITHTLALNLC
jgi:hypothetical protein